MPLHNGFYGTHAYSFKTRAIVGDTATLTLFGGSFTVKASSYEEIETKADANGPAKAGGSSAGVGAGIAVDVTGIDVASIVADGVNIIQKNDAPLTKIEITVAHSGNEMMEAKAGSSGGISISPVVALMISGAYTEARLGSGAKLTAKGDVRVEAQSALVREMAANASAAGGRVGVGGSFNISILNDSAEAYVRRSLKSCNLTVNAVSRSTLKSTSRAGAKGASSGSTAAGSGTGTTTSGGSGDDADDGSSKGESDQQADHLIGGGGKLAGRTGSTNTSAAITNRMNSGRQGAQTSEGSIQIAAAFNLNIMKNRAEASIADGLWVRAEDDGSGQHGTISVTAANNTDATIRANASATNSKIGVGVAVAINIASYHNIASIGKTTVEASKLTVSATMPADLKKTATTVASTGEAINSLDAYVTSGVQALLSQILDAIGLDEETSEAVSKELATVVGDLVGTITRELLSGTGLEQLLSTDIVTKIDKRLGELGEVVTESVKTRMIDFVINQVLSQIAGHFNLKDQSTTPTEPGVMTFSSQVKKELQLIASDVFEGIVDVNQFMNFIKGNWQETLKNNALNAVKKSGKVLTTAALDGLSNWLNLKIKASDIGPTHEFVTQAVSGAGASNVGVAGAAAIAVISGETKAYLADGDASVPVDVTGTLTIFAKGTQVEDTVASSAVGDDGMPDRNKAAGGDSDVGSGSAGSYAGKEVEGSGGKLVIGTTNNGRITSLAKPAADEDTYRIKVKADEGYKLSGLTLTRSDTGATLNVNITGGVFDAATNEWLYTYSLTGDGLADDAVLTAMALFETDNKTVKSEAPQHGTIKVTDTAGAAVTDAKMGDRLLVVVTPESGYTLDKLQYTYTVNGQAQTKDIVTYEKVGGNVLTFYMPDANAVIKATFRMLNPGETPLNTSSNTTSSGKSVGVGAAFALNVAEMTVEAGIGKNRTVTAGSADVRAEGWHDSDTITVSGTDPLSGDDNTGVNPDGSTAPGASTAKAKDISLDASAAVGLIDNTVRAYVQTGTSVTTTREDGIVLSEKELTVMDALTGRPVFNQAGKPETETIKELASFRLSAKQTGHTLTKASGFAVGGQAAVGAAVAVNIASSDVTAEFLGMGNLTGAADITAYTYNEDDSYGIATAMGADLERHLQKFRTGTQQAEDAVTGVAQGDYSKLHNDTGTQNQNNQTAGKVNGKLNENSTETNDGTNNALGGMVVKANDVLVSATADSRLYNIAAGAAGSGTAAVTAVAVVTYFKNTTTAYLADGTVIGTAASPVTGDVAVLANSYEFVTADAAGMSGGGTAGVGGTLDVLVTLVKTSAFTGNNVAVYAAGDVNVRAVDEYDLVAVVVTAAGSGTAAVGVTALVSVSFNTITAVIGETNTIVGKSFTLLASSNRDVVSTVATVAASGVAGVGVSLSVVVSGNKMSQDAHDSLYQNDGSQLTTTRDGTLYLVYDYAYEASGETVHVTVYEAPDGKLYRMDSNGNLVPYTVDKAKLTNATAGNLDPQTQLDGAFKLGHSSARANKPGESLNDLLAGDGQRGGEEDYSSYGQDTSGQIYVLANGKYIPVTDEEYESKYNGQQRYLYNSRTKQYEKTSKSASENQQFGSGEDGRANAPDSSQFDSAAEGLGYSSAARDGLKDSTTAEVMGKGTAIRAVGGDINVLAADAVSAVMVSGTVAIGGTGAGVGVGLSSSTFFSNVQALVQSGAILRASGDVNVKASSGASEDVLAPLDKEVEGGTVSQSSVKAELQKQGVGEVNESSALYLISFTAGGGFVGVGVGAATLIVFKQVKAILAGDIAGAQNVNVEGGMDFGRVLTVTSGVSGGAVAVNVSLGATHFGGSVETAIAGNAWLRDVSENINVKTSGKTNVVTAAGTIAGGAGAVNAGVAIATNITEVHTYIGQGVVVDAPAANINLSTTFEANANASIIAIMGGAIAEGASVAISVNRLSAQTYIGTTPQGTAQSGAASSEKGRIAASAVCVESDVQGISSVYGASIAGGVVAVNGVVALAFNRAAGIAAVNQANLDAASLSVLAQMAGDVIVRTVAAAGGGIAVGATVAVAEQKTDNRALIDASDSRLSISGNITVSAGTKEAPYNSDATVTSITGAAGGVAVAMNFAVATNEAGNRALVQGVSGMLNAHNLSIEAHGNAHAYAVIGNAAAGSIAANVSFAYARRVKERGGSTPQRRKTHCGNRSGAAPGGSHPHGRKPYGRRTRSAACRAPWRKHYRSAQRGASKPAEQIACTAKRASGRAECGSEAAGGC